MSKIKDFFSSGNAVVKVLSFIGLFIWVVNLIGGTAYHFWASKTLVDAGIIKTGFGIYGIFNILVSAAAFPLVLKAWNVIMDNKKGE